MAALVERTVLALPKFDRKPKILVVVAPYMTDIAQMLYRGASRILEQAGAAYERVDVPGALEIPQAIRIASQTSKYDGYVALGCVMRGETTHYETVSNESARGLTLLGLDSLCIGNGILTVENYNQAEVRADPDGQDKGGDAAAAALRLVAMKLAFGFQFADSGSN